MRYKLILLLTLMISIIIGCKENEFEENVELKASLQGTWKLVSEPSIWTQVTINDHTISWYDSTVMMFNDKDGEIQTERGRCPVKFAFNDGSIGFTFSGTTENNVLWFLLNEGENSTIVDYRIENGIVSVGQSWQAPQPIGPRHFNTCFVRFSSDRNTVEFCDGDGTLSPIDCITYHKVN